MITLKGIIPQAVDVYRDTEDGTEYIGRANEYEFNDLRIQIKNENATGYYAIFNPEWGDVGMKVVINPNGSITNWPKGFFDLYEQQLDQLVTW